MHIGLDFLPLTGQNAGLQRYAHQLVHSLAVHDSENKYTILINDRTPQTLLPESPNFYTIQIDTPKTAPFVWNQVYVPQQLLRIDFDIIHSPVSPPVYITPNTASIVTIHDLTFRFYPETMTRFSRVYWSVFTRFGLKRVDSLITVSESTKQDMVSEYGVAECDVISIPLAIDNDLNRSISPEVTSDILSKYTIEEPYLLYVGTIEPRKNIVRLIKAFNQVNQNSEFEHQLVIAGKKGWLFDEVFEIVQKLDLKRKVTFTGFVPDEHLPVLYNSADVFVFPSLYEGFGLPPLEAMAYGTPVIVANSSSLPEVVGDAGLLVNPMSIDDIAESIFRLALNENLKSELGEKAKCRSKMFSLDLLAERTLDVYRETQK